VRIFENGARYRIVELTPANSMTWLKNRIAQDFTEKQLLTSAMEHWYASGKKGRFLSLTASSTYNAALAHG